MQSGDVSIVAGGWSVRNIALDRLCGVIIGVNDAAVNLPRADIVVSMDRKWVEYRWPWIASERAPLAWLRRSAVQNIPRPLPSFVRVFECDNESSLFSAEPDRLNGTNSGACALNLAWKMKPRRVFLLGFDMCRDAFGHAYWHAPYPWNPNGATTDGKYQAWAGQFKAAARAFEKAGVEVFNVSSASLITNFPKMTPARYARECSK